jgi:hypothetical protein
MNKNSDLSVKYFSTKLEFQGRGAGHNHGVLWVDLKKMELKINNSKGDLIYIGDLLPKKGIKKIKFLLRKALYTVVVKKENLEGDEKIDMKNAVIQLGSKLSPPNENIDEILAHFKFYGIDQAFKKFKAMDHLLDYEEAAIIAFADKFTTVSLSPHVIGEKAAKIAYKVNRHKHTKACRKYGTKCRFNFPRFPVWKTIVAQPIKLEGEAGKVLADRYQKLLTAVQLNLLDDETINEVCSKHTHPTNRAEYEANRESKIKMILRIVGLNDDTFHVYLDALRYSKKGFKVILARDVDEIFVNSFNPEWAENWNGNTDLQITLRLLCCDHLHHRILHKR